ncbi:MAG: sugar-transfer associated ATP-grasp domain-containing protein [Limisphaerales bacterium]
MHWPCGEDLEHESITRRSPGHVNPPATPKLLAIVLPGRTGWLPHGLAPASPREWGKFLRLDCPTELAVKPVSGNYGSGIRILTRTATGDFSQLGSAPVSCQHLAEQLYTEPTHTGYILQERIHNHPDLLALSQSPGFQCVRLIVMTDPHGQGHILHARLKIIVRQNPYDNFQFGNSGNFLARVEIPTGRLFPALNRNPLGPGYVEIHQHPASGRQITGLRLPHWEATCRLVSLASRPALASTKNPAPPLSGRTGKGRSFLAGSAGC